ncbi:type IV pili twitching motility protein PilT [bacterium B13(2017)]|nr:type IV pili twitching motility protein PilT [bacterium B13(2017)]
MDMLEILNHAVQNKASDIHIVPLRKPIIRLSGRLIELEQYPVLSSDDSKNLIYSILYDEQKQKFEENWELDCSFDVPNLSRFRVNVLIQKNGIGAVLRIISSTIPTSEELTLPKAVVGLADIPRGLVLVTGPTGSGKSSTLACLIDIINQKRQEHILTIEDPIEFVYETKNCVITQREIGMHSKNFCNSLRASLREDPDVILIGEMRDLETIQAAITLAETGHLVFGTLHTTDAPQTIDRIVDVFPPYQQTQVRMQLSVSLQAVICQQLLPKLQGKGRIAVREIMMVTTAIANLIREGKTHQIYSAIDMGVKYGMISMDKALIDLANKAEVSKEMALMKANNPQVVAQQIGIKGF